MALGCAHSTPLPCRRHLTRHSRSRGKEGRITVIASAYGLAGMMRRKEGSKVAMAEPLVIQLNLLEGSPQEEGPFTRIHILRRDREVSYLFVVSEAEGPDAAEACAWLPDKLIQELDGSRLSVTGRLQEGLKRVHEALLQENRQSLPEHRTLVGSVCAYLRGVDLYLAHAGPTIACVVGPQSQRRLAPAPGNPSAPLGCPEPPQIWVRHHRLRPGETLVMASSGLAPVGQESRALASFQGRLEDGMIAVYRRVHGNRAFGALAVDPRLDGATVSFAPSPTAAFVPESMRPPLSTAPYSYGQRSASPGLPPSQSVETPPAPGLGLSIDLKGPPRRVSRWARSLFPPQALLALTGLFLAGGLLFAAQSVAQGMGQQTRDRAVAQIQQAGGLMQQARTAPTANQQRRLLIEALERLDAAQKNDPGHPDVVPLSNQIRGDLRSMDASYPLHDLRSVLDFSAIIGNPTQLRDLVHHQNTLYLLEKVDDRVFQVPLSGLQGDGSPPIPTPLPQTEEIARRNLVKLLWLPAGSVWPRDSLFALDEYRGLQELRLGEEPRPLPLRGAQEWASFQTAAGFNGSLFILDPRESQVWRYVPTDNGFDSERQPALPSSDLRDAVDLLVDGDFYVLLRTGTILKFSKDGAEPFTQDGLDRPLKNPATFAGGVDTRGIYVADTGNKRIVVFDKQGGRFLRQFPLEALPQIHGLWVDETGGRLVMISDSSLYLATLPQ